MRNGAGKTTALGIWSMGLDGFRRRCCFNKPGHLECHDVGKGALDLARDAGITVPDSQLIRVGAGDGDQRSYLEIAGVIEEHSAAAIADLRQLWAADSLLDPDLQLGLDGC